MSKLNIIVLRDAQGNYYALPRDGVMQARVPDEYKGEIETALRDASGELSESELEEVTGGGLSVLEVSTSSGFTYFSELQDKWASP